MFGKKKKVKEEKPVLDYTKWAEDLGFLHLIMNRKKAIIKEYVIRVYSQQLNDDSYIRDEDIDPLITRCVSEVMNNIGRNYKTFLADKYFGDESQLIAYITEDYYAELVSESIKSNNKKIIKGLSGKKATDILKMNANKE